MKTENDRLIARLTHPLSRVKFPPPRAKSGRRRATRYAKLVKILRAFVRDLGRRRRSGSRDVCWSVVQTLHRSPCLSLSLSLRPPFEPRECMSRTISLNSIKPRGKRFFPSFSRSSPPPPEILCGLGDLLPILPRGDILSGIEKLCDRMIATLGETRYVEGRETNGADNRGNEIDPRDLRRV